MRVIGLTGSIGSGKSFVSEIIVDHGFTLIDSDIIAHEITEKGSPVLAELQDRFDKDILTEEGELNRKYLAELTFSDPSQKEALIDIVTSKVISVIDDKLALLREEGFEEAVFVDAPVLYESGASYLVDEVWLVVADDEIRAKRVMERDNCTYEEFLLRDKNQLPQEEKILMADVIIDNNGTEYQLYNQLETLFALLEGDLFEE